MRITKKYMTDYEIEMELDEALEKFRGLNTPVNLSYWNSGSEYKAQIKKILKLEGEQDIFDYHYYFPEDIKKKIAQKLGFSVDDCKKAFFHALSQSTLSIAVISVLLSRMKVKLGIVAPVYFSVLDCCDDLKVPYRVFDGFLPDLKDTFDEDVLLKSDCGAFWFTSPVNSCSIHFSQQVKNIIQKLLDAGKIVILDESLTVNSKELARTFGVQENLIYIYSPHKSLGLQGIKFSALVADKKYYDEINNLIDSFGGSLNYSCQQGVSHFVSKNFDECLSIYNQFWQENFSAVRKILASYSFASVPQEIYGHYAIIFVDGTIDDRAFVDAMRNLMKEKGYFVYPGSMQGFGSKQCFCFRINLLLNRSDLEQGLKAVLDYFKDNLGAAR